MTNEEAIYALKNTAWLGSDKDREATEEAVNMAIEALTQDSRKVTQESTQDLISRQDARKAIFDLGGVSTSISESSYNRGIRDAVNIIKELPSAELKREECEEREQGLCPYYAG